MTREYYVYTYWRLDINEPFYVGSGRLSNGTKLVWRYLIWKHNKRYRIKQLS